MSDLSKPSDASDGSTRKKLASNPPALRPLAPKPLPTPAPRRTFSGRASITQSSTASSSRRPSPAACVVCFRLGCQLPTHTAYASTSRSSSASSAERPSISTLSAQQDPVFASSYAYKLGQHHVDTSISSSMTDLLYSLPLSAEMNTTEMRHLFHSWFDVDSHHSFRVPRPLEIVGDTIWSPFFLPALQDPLLCLSVLAASAASRPRYSGQPSRNVTSLTLLGQAIQQMRERISSDPTDIADTTIIAAVFLWLVNIFLEDTAAMTSHANSIYAFVETRGGLKELGFVGAVASFIRWVDACHSFILPVTCHYLDTPSLESPFAAGTARYGLFWDDPDAAAEMGIDTEVVSSCQESCRMIEQLEHMENNEVSGAQYTRMVQCLGTIFTQGSVLRARSHSQADSNECVVAALSLIQFKCFCGLENLDIVVTTNVTKLVRAIKSTGGPTFWQQQPALLIWLLFVVVMTPAKVTEKTWCLPLLCRVVSTQFGHKGRLKSSWKQQLKACLGEFVWSNGPLDQLFVDTCQLIEEELNENEEDDDDDSDDGDGEDAMDEG